MQEKGILSKILNQRPENLWRENPQTNGKEEDKIKHQ